MQQTAEVAVAEVLNAVGPVKCVNEDENEDENEEENEKPVKQEHQVTVDDDDDAKRKKKKRAEVEQVETFGRRSGDQ